MDTHRPSGSGDLTRPHPVFWFDDGTLVLQVEDVLFQVHRGLLIRLSPFLDSACKAATSVASLKPLPGAPQAQTSGADVGPGRESGINIDIGPEREVRSIDVENLFKVLYHDSPFDSSMSFGHVASMLRVSSPQQLDIPTFHSRAKKLVTSMIPLGPVPYYRSDFLEEALEIAVEYGITSIRKTLFYSVMTQPDFDSDEKPGSTESNPSPEIISSTDGVTRRHSLPPNITQLCVELMSQVINHFTPILFTPAATPHMACTDVFADMWMSLVIQPALGDDGVYKPLETLERMKAIDWGNAGLCQSCVLEKRDEWTEEQNVVWRMMDVWLPVPAVMGRK